jgi:glucokinase
VRRVYARECGVPFENAPEPKDIFEIGMGRAEGNRSAAVEAFRQMGEVAGDVLAQALTLVDGLAVVGGGISAAHPLFLPALVDAANADYEGASGRFRRLVPKVFNLEDPAQLQTFLTGEQREITVYGSSRKIRHDPMPRTGVGISRLGTSEAVAVGACAFALRKLG